MNYIYGKIQTSEQNRKEKKLTIDKQRRKVDRNK